MERMIDAFGADAVVIERVLRQTRDLGLAEGTGRGEGDDVGQAGENERAVTGSRSVEERVGAVAPIKGHRGLAHESEMNLIGRRGIRRPPDNREERDCQQPMRPAM